MEDIPECSSAAATESPDVINVEPPKKKIKSTPNSEEKLLETASSLLNKVNENSSKEKKREFSSDIHHFVNFIGSELSSIQDKAVVARLKKKFILDIFEAKEAQED